MTSRFLPCRSWRLAFALLASAVVAHATSTPSDPVGAFRMRLRAGSDTLVSLPLQRAALVECPISQVAFNQITPVGYFASIPAGGAYLLVMSGALEGAVLPVTSTVSTHTLVVDAGTYNLSSLKTEVANGSGQGDLVALIPYWTLDTVFPAGAGVQASSNRALLNTQVLAYDDTAIGTNLSAAAVYFYFAGDGSYAAGWYRFGDMSATAGGTRIPPHRYFVVRNPAGAETEILLTGAVRMAGYSIPLATLQAGRDQDNFVALPVPLPVTLAGSGLQESGAFAVSTNRALPQDQLLVFDNTVVGQNKSASAVYFYFAGNTSFAAGWYRFGDMTQTAGNFTLKPGNGYIIRKHATTPAEIRTWVGVPGYLQ